MTESPRPPKFTAPTFKTQPDSPEIRPTSAYGQFPSKDHSPSNFHPAPRPTSLTLTIGSKQHSPISPYADDLQVKQERTPRIRVVSATSAVGSGSKVSRRSSCDLCHVRKIRCDQIRPSCSSCTRKGKICHYDEETDSSNVYTRVLPKSTSITVVSATNPDEKYTVAIPRPAPSPLTATDGRMVSVMDTPLNGKSGRLTGNGQMGSGSERSLSGSGEKTRKRDRIVNGFDSDSEGEDNTQSLRSGQEGSTNGKRIGISDLIEGGQAGRTSDQSSSSDKESRGDKVGEEIDELESGDELESSNKKRESALDDEISGELLELASAPPQSKKAKLQRPEVATGPVLSRTVRSYKPPNRSHQGPRHSLPSGLASGPSSAFPPTPQSTKSLTASQRFDPYTTPLQSLMESLPSPETQSILFKTFFADPILTEGISLLRPQFLGDFRGLMERRYSRLREGDATTLANGFAFLAVALRILPEETSKLLLASASVPTSAASSGTSLPRSLPRIITGQAVSSTDPTPLDQRYLDLSLLVAQIAEQSDLPSMMTVMLKLVLHRYTILSGTKDRLVLAGGWLAQAIKIAQALGMGKEWEGIPQGERELRRRVMWALYIADRQYSFETSFPYTILDAHQGIHLPSPISEADLYKISPETPALPPHSTEVGPTDCTALFIHTHLARRVTPILDSLATVSAAGTPHDLILRFDASLDQFQDALPPYLKLFPMTDTQWDSAHPYLPSHRVRLHSILLGYRMGVHRTHLMTYLNPATPVAMRQVIAQLCLSTLRVQRSARMLDPKIAPRMFKPAVVFEAAATLALIMLVERSLHAPSTTDVNGMVNTPEFNALRAGMAEAGELLDNVGGGSDEAVYARKAVSILREIMVKVNSPSRLASTNAPRLSPIPTPNVTPPEKDAISRPTSSAGTDTPLTPAQGIVTWLEAWGKTSLSVEYLMKEAEWTGAWEAVVTAMVL